MTVIVNPCHEGQETRMYLNLHDPHVSDQILTSADYPGSSKKPSIHFADPLFHWMPAFAGMTAWLDYGSRPG